MKIDDLLEELDDAKREIAELKEKTKFRELTEEQKANIKKQLSERPPGRIDVAHANNEDAQAYASQFAELFSQAGWQASIGVAVLSSYSDGLWLVVHDIERAQVGAIWGILLSSKVEV